MMENTKTEEEKIIERNFMIIGKYISFVNGIDLFVNLIFEMVVAEHEPNIKTVKEVKELIHFIQEQSVSKRIGTLCLVLSISKGYDVEIQNIIKELREIAKVYNKSIRPIRDLLAHNPHMFNKKKMEGSILSVRLIDDKPPLAISEIENGFTIVNEMVLKMQTIAEKLQQKYPKHGPGRRFNSK